jgi:hypothetical protein
MADSTAANRPDDPSPTATPPPGLTRVSRHGIRYVAGRAGVAGLAAVLGVTVLAGVPAIAAPPAAGSTAVSSGKPVPQPPAPAKPTGMTTLSNGSGASSAQTQAMQAAATKARTTGGAVAVDPLTTETTQVLAQPQGGFVVSTNPQPVRARQHNTWVPVDTTLAVNRDGTLSPAATAYGTVAFSGGGTTALAVTSSGGVRYSLSWPGRLPKPVVTGSSATYREVYPGVDLQVSATITGGFSEVLVVHTAQAATNPALTHITFTTSLTGGRLDHSPASGGVMVSGAPGTPVLESGTALGWDSATSTPAVKNGTADGGAPHEVAPAVPDPSDAAHAGAAAHTTVIGAQTTPTGMTLTPDRGLLTSPATVFPVYLDPTFNWHPAAGGGPAFDEIKQGSPCNGASYYNNAGSSADNGHLGVGVARWGGGCEGVMRALYAWTIPSVLYGAHIASGTVNATEMYSATCSTTATVNLHLSGAMGSGTDWNNRPGYLGSFNAAVSYAPSYNGDYCPSNGTVTHGFDVTSLVNQAASGRWPTLTVALAEDGAEAANDRNGFKRFTDNPSLTIAYNLVPNTPGAVQMAAKSGANNAGCATTSPYPYMGKSIATNTPVLSSQISDPDGDSLQAQFSYWIDGAATGNTGYSGDNLASGSTATYSLPPSFVSGLTNGQVIDWQVLVSDGQATATAWSPICHFIAWPTAPVQPTITSDGTYPDLDATRTFGPAASTDGHFTFAATGATTAVTQFVYDLDQVPATVNPPSWEIATATGNTATVDITPWAPGPHTLSVYAMDAAGDVSAMATYRFGAIGDANYTCATLTACLNNTAISPDNAMTDGAADGYDSYSATDLTNAGWTSGSKVIIDGAPLTLPTFGAGQNDNVLAANQTITYPYTVPATGPAALVMLASSSSTQTVTPGEITGNDTAPYVTAGTPVSGRYCFDSTNPSNYCPATGTITYTDGTTQTYDMTAPDWIDGPATLSAVMLPHINSPAGQTTDTTRQPKIYPFSIPLRAGKTLASVTLPDVANEPWANTPVLHIFGMSTRDTTTATVTPTGTSTTPATGQTWTGAWSSPTEGPYWLSTSDFTNQTFRIAVKPSISGSTVRVKLDNALSAAGPLHIGHATIAATTASSPTATPTGTPTNLTFGGSTAVTIPDGGMVYSDPLPFTVTASQYLLVSYDLTNDLPYLPQHTWTSNSYQYITAPGSGDHTADTTTTAYTATGSVSGWFTDVLTGLDITTTGTPTQAVLGDGLIDAWQPGATPPPPGSNRLSDNLATTATSTTPAGTLAEGIESNQILRDFPETYNGGDVGGPAALSRIDRDILDQPGLTTVILNEGLDDTLNGASATTLEAGYNQLLTYLKTNNINVIIIGLTPCDGYTGDNATGNSSNDPCTTTIDTNRTTTNGWLANGPLFLNPWTTPAVYYLDPDTTIGVTDTTNNETKLHTNAARTDHINLTDPGYAALTTANLGPQDTWPLNDGALDNTTTTATDTATNTTSPYLINNPAVGQNPATLNGTTTWTTDPTRGEVLTFDGTTGNASTSNQVLDTTKSFTISTWVNMTTLPTHNATIASQNATNVSAFFLQYNYAHANAPYWAFETPTTDIGTVGAENHIRPGHGHFDHVSRRCCARRTQPRLGSTVVTTRR